VKKSLKTKQERYLKKIQREEDEKRFFNRNFEAMSFCNKHGLTIYVAAQWNSVSTVKIFVQKGEKFKLLNNIEYNQQEPEDVFNYVVAIDKEYERLYNKMKNKV